MIKDKIITQFKWFMASIVIQWTILQFIGFFAVGVYWAIALEPINLFVTSLMFLVPNLLILRNRKKKYHDDISIGIIGGMLVNALYMHSRYCNLEYLGASGLKVNQRLYLLTIVEFIVILLIRIIISLVKRKKSH